MKIVLAGAVSLFGHEEIMRQALLSGFEIKFYDAPFMKKYWHSDFPVVFADGVDENDGVVVPLTEYWISWCIENQERCRISRKALEASRSKSKLYSFLGKFRVPELFASVEEARTYVHNGGSVVIKPEGLLSSYGVEIVDQKNISMMEEFIRQTQSIRNKVVRIMNIPACPAIITEKIHGVEYSADCFVNAGNFFVVRVCRKKTVIINNKPCALVVQVVPASKKICMCLENWCNELFEKDDISFAQFDFIQDSSEKDFVPIDFASRIGGGMKELFSEFENVYANAFSHKEIISPDSKNFPAMVNYLPVVNGYVMNDNYNLLEGKQFVFKNKGDFVNKNPGSVMSRVACVILRHPEEFTDEEMESFLIGEEFIAEK